MSFNQYFSKKKIDKLLKTITFLKYIAYWKNGVKNIIRYLMKNLLWMTSKFRVNKNDI